MSSNRFMTLPEPFDALARGMDEVLGGVLGGGLASTAPRAPIALWEDDANVHLEVEVPGLGRDDLDLEFEDGRLTVSGERKPAERSGRVRYDERPYGRFERVVALSGVVDPDAIEAELRDGVLSLTMRKKPEARPHRIGVRTDERPRLGQEGPAPADQTAAAGA